MRHRKAKITLDRSSAAREALLKGLVRSLVVHGHMVTTQARARAVRPRLERLITLAKRNTLHARRLLIQRTGSPEVSNLLLNSIAPRFVKRNGGYTRSHPLLERKGDRANMVRVEILEM